MFIFLELTREEFDQFSSNHDQGNYLQSLAMADLLEKRGWDVHLVGIKSKNTVVAGTLLSSMSIKVGRYFSILGGPLLDYNNNYLLTLFFESLKEYIKKNKGLYLNISPNIVYKYCDDRGACLLEKNVLVHQSLLSYGFIHNGFTHTYANENPRVVYVKDLTNLTEQNLIKSYNSSTRTKVNKTKKSNIKIRELTREELPLFEQIMIHTATRQSFNDKGLNYYKHLYDSFGDKAHFMVAEIDFFQYIQENQSKLEKLQQKLKNYSDKEDKLKQYENVQREILALKKKIIETQEFLTTKESEQALAVGLFIDMPQETLFLFGGMYNKYKNFLSPSYYLQHVMMEQSIFKGIERYNFYGIEGIYDGSDGVLNFKKGFEGIVEEKVGTYTLVTSPIKYNMYCALKKIIGNLNSTGVKK